MQLFGLDITGEHVKLLLPLIGGAVAAGGFLAGRWSSHRKRVLFRNEDLVSSSIVIELYGIAVDSDGFPMLHIVTQGGSSSIEDFFHNPLLVRLVQREVTRHRGLVQLASPVAHRMMMDAAKDALTGLDPIANMDFVHGRPTQDDETLFAFAAFAEQGRAENGLHDQIARLVLMVVSPSLIGRLADPEYVRHLRVRHSGYRPRCERLHAFANEWQRLQALPSGQRSSATDKIWQVTVRTLLR